MVGHKLCKANIFIAKWINPKCRNIAVKSLHGCKLMAGVKHAQKLNATKLSVLHQASVSSRKIMTFIAMIEYVIAYFLYMFKI